MAQGRNAIRKPAMGWLIGLIFVVVIGVYMAIAWTGGWTSDRTRTANNISSPATDTTAPPSTSPVAPPATPQPTSGTPQ